MPRPDRNRLNTPLRAGFILLGVAAVTHWAVGHFVPVPNDLADFAEGLLYGLSIAAMLVGVRRGCGPSAPAAG